MGIIRSEENEVERPKDIDKFVEWSHKWLIPLNLENCKVIRGVNTTSAECTIR